MKYTHPYSRGFSIGVVQEGYRRWHFMFWKWEWHYSVPMTDPDYVRKHLERQAAAAYVPIIAELRAKNARLEVKLKKAIQ